VCVSVCECVFVFRLCFHLSDVFFFFLCVVVRVCSFVFQTLGCESVCVCVLCVCVCWKV